MPAEEVDWTDCEDGDEDVEIDVETVLEAPDVDPLFVDPLVLGTPKLGEAELNNTELEETGAAALGSYAIKSTTNNESAPIETALSVCSAGERLSKSTIVYRR